MITWWRHISRQNICLCFVVVDPPTVYTHSVLVNRQRWSGFQVGHPKCPGHYKYDIQGEAGNPAPVPSILIAAEVKQNAEFGMERYRTIAHRCIVRPQVVQFYVEHLKQVKLNRARGAEKGKRTRLAKKAAANKAAAKK